MTTKPSYEELERRVQELEKIESEYKSSKEALRNSEAQYRLLFEHANLGIFIAQDGYLKAPNPYLAHILDYSLSELEDQPFSQFIHPEHLPLVNKRHQERLSGKTGLPQTYDFRVISKNGTIIWVQLSTVLIQLKGRPATLNFLHDITKRKRVEEALRESEESYRRLADNSPDMIYRMSLPEGRYEYVSPASTHIFGYPPQTWYDNPLLVRKTLHPDYLSYFQKQWENLLKGDLPPSYEYKIIHKDGSVRWVNQRNILVKNEEDRPLAIEGILTDITDRKHMEEALRESEEKYRILFEYTGEALFVAQHLKNWFSRI